MMNNDLPQLRRDSLFDYLKLVIVLAVLWLVIWWLIPYAFELLLQRMAKSYD